MSRPGDLFEQVGSLKTLCCSKLNIMSPYLRKGTMSRKKLIEIFMLVSTFNYLLRSVKHDITLYVGKDGLPFSSQAIEVKNESHFLCYKNCRTLD